jgi:hypothetical protein
MPKGVFVMTPTLMFLNVVGMYKQLVHDCRQAGRYNPLYCSRNQIHQAHVEFVRTNRIWYRIAARQGQQLLMGDHTAPIA